MLVLSDLFVCVTLFQKPGTEKTRTVTFFSYFCLNTRWIVSNLGVKQDKER